MTVVNRIKSTSAAIWVRALAMLIVLVAGGSAMAQTVVVFVNGDPITAIDIEHRSKFLVLTGQKAVSRQEVLDQLIDEILKVREGRRWGIDISNAEVDASYARMARGMNQSGEQLTQSLAQKGIGAGTLKSRIRADMVWQQLVRDQVIRSSADLPDNHRKILDSVPVGELTPPEVTRHGVEMFAVCSRNETKTDTPIRKKTREALMTKRFEEESKKYLRLLRKNAMIERGK
jgi:parvulin-like peptidyl-prolyl isomerase